MRRKGENSTKQHQIGPQKSITVLTKTLIEGFGRKSNVIQSKKQQLIELSKQIQGCTTRKREEYINKGKIKIKLTIYNKGRLRVTCI
ncbi:hypothetical protein AAHA92_17113 [Salvia divinorum]|uniref:Uncharacterized protein n=1 Tax=Salvia divinorum TaxID=28513 RepID=A0ABD1GXR3_SALDI